MKYFSEFLYEANKSGDSSLRDWFSKSISSDGTPGWVQLGGKYAGKPCAKQPGQTTKPKCGSSKMKAELSDEEEKKAFRRKNLKDPNPDRKGKAKNVATEEIELTDSYGEVIGKIEDKKIDDEDKSSDNGFDTYDIEAMTEEDKKDHEFAMARSQLKTLKSAANRLQKKMGKTGEGELKAWVQSKITKATDYIDTAADYVTNEEKDACYHKVKARYSVWPSAYASGALVKCRKKGAKNWGNKSKNVKEDYSRIQSRGMTYTIMLNWRGQMLSVQMFFPKFSRPTKEEVTFEVRKLYPDARILSFNPSIKDPTKPLLYTGDTQ
jgi:hypothetical protein